MTTPRRGLRAPLRRLRLSLLPVPIQAAGLAVLVAVLAAAVVSAPLMTASAEQAAWEQQEQRFPASALGTTVLSSTYTGDGSSPVDRLPRLDDLDAAVTQTAADSGLGHPLWLARVTFPAAAQTLTGVEAAAFVHRTGAADHLDIVDGAASDDGVLVPEELAADAGVRPGGTLTLLPEHGPPVPLLVSGVYRVPTDPVPAWWEAQNYLFVPRFEPGAPEPTPPPPAIVAPRRVALATFAALREHVFLEWFLPPRADAPVAEARRTAERVADFQLRAAAPESPVAALLGSTGFAGVQTRTVLPNTLTVVDRTVELLSPPVRAVGIGGGAAALVLVGSWAGLRVRRRDDELRSLTARGLSPARGAVDAAREALVPGLVGLAAGGAAGWLLVARLGPSGNLPSDLITEAVVALLAAGGAVLVVVATVTAVLIGRLDQVGRGQAAALLGRVPWLAVTAAVTAMAALPLVTGSRHVEAGRIGVLPLLVPLLVTVVAAGALTALLPRIGSRADARLRRLPVGPFLAVRRLLAGHAAARLVVVTTAVSLGLVVYAGALADSTNRTIAAKASVATGSDVVVPIIRTSASDGPLPPEAMLVGTENSAKLVPGKTPADVLVVHPEQVADVVRWNDSFADRPLEELMGALENYRGDRVPVVVAGPLPDTVTEATDGELVLDFIYYSVPVEVVARAAAFPGQGSKRPLLVADWDRYGAALESLSRVPDLVLDREVWARGDVPDVVDALAAAGYEPGDPGDIATAEDFAARPELDAQTWSLGYLRAVALAAGILGLVGVAMHALSQQRRRTVADLLLTRMGLRRRSADGATGLEIGLLTGLAALVAAAVALPASALVLGLLDPVPGLRPDPLFSMPWASIGVVAAGVVLVTACAAVLVGRTARRTSGGQVMRDAS